MSFFRQGLALAVAGAGLAVVPSMTTGAASAAPDDRGLVAQMRDDARGGVAVSDERATGKVDFIRATGAEADLLPARQADGRAEAVAKAEAYLADYAPAFGAPSAQLVEQSVARGQAGSTVVTFTQRVQGVPVFGSMLKAHLDAEGDLTAVNGELVPVSGLDTDARLSPARAGQAAVALVRAAPPTDDAGAVSTRGLEAGASDLVVYRSGLTQGVAGGQNRLVYAVEVTNGANVRDMVFLDADTAKVVNRYTLLDSLDSPHRVLYEADADRALTKVWEEGGALPGELNADQENLVLSAGEAYWLFNNAFGRDSFDGEGSEMLTVNNDPAISCPNANWNGITTNYCDGVTSDDVVSHEWTHAYTEYTHGLIYQWQAGALNESYSDIFGETLDLVNGREDEGEGDITAPRPVDRCSTHSPATPMVTITAPSDIARDCATAGASFGRPLDEAGITAAVVAPTDAVEDAGGTATDGCSAYDQDVTGQIVLVDRGLCAFTDKAEVATAEGAAALIIGNRDDAPIGMSGDDPSLVTTASIGLTDRAAIRASLADGEVVTITMKDAAGQRTDSYRWLIGEKSTAFGGAIRDMWSPTCYGDPAKVSDVEYKCSTDDAGGVHSNSGVPNHGYALLVDGGTFNGTRVRPIGIDKALNIYYKAMTEYQTPASSFADHASSLEASCADLTGRAINVISTDANDRSRSVDTITAADCAQVTAMAAAVELRKDPTDQCSFAPLLAPDAPSLCGAGFGDTEVFGEDFENGLDGWTVTGENPYGGTTFPWSTTRRYRGDHTGAVAYAKDPDAGDCTGGPNDISSVDYLTSGDITMPTTGQGQRLSFDHYVATELGYDGGNVQLSVNGGDFAPIEEAAYVFNAPTTIETTGNTNPLAGEAGFTGTDGGTVFGSWGTSVVDLAEAGVAPGDTLQVRFAMGRDGCGGASFFGWYVDDVSIAVCEVVVSATTTKAINTLPRTVRTDRPFAVRARVSSAGELAPTGPVELRFKGKRIGRDTVNGRGVALIASNRRFGRPGARRMTVVYRGDDHSQRSRDSVRVQVRRR